MQHILITGAGGYIGKQLGAQLQQSENCTVLGIDLHLPKDNTGFDILKLDIRDKHLSQLMAEHNITHVVHLASIVSPGQDEQLEYDIDVNGTKNVIAACQVNQVQHLTITSSGAAYGYHADNPEWLTENHELRGNEEFSYSRHKRLVESLLAEFSQQQDTTQILILRPCTVLGKTTNNKITALFERKKLLKVGDSDSPFVFIWDKDVVNALMHGVTQQKAGQYNLAGDGKLNVEQLANITNKAITQMPAFLLKAALWWGNLLNLTSNRPEQVIFLQYRPVLDNHRLKTDFGYVPAKTSQQAFEYFWSHRQSNITPDKSTNSHA